MKHNTSSLMKSNNKKGIEMKNVIKQTVELGDRVKCEVTGLEGIVTTVAKNLYGCDRIVVQPKVAADGKVPESTWVDLTGAIIIKKGVVKGHTGKDRGELGGPSLGIQTPRKMP